MVDGEGVILPKWAAALIAAGAFVDGAATVMYLSERRFPLGREPNWGWIVAGWLMTCMIFASADKFRQPTARRIVKYIGLVTLVETVSSTTSYFTTPIPAIITGCLTIASIGLVVFACMVHLRTRVT
jgi:hypothetical protein